MSAETEEKPAVSEAASSSEPAPPSLLVELFEREGEQEAVAGNRPFLLDDPSVVRLVHTGNIEVFTVPVKDGDSAGARSYFMTVKAGGLLCGMDTALAGHGFLAVGLVGTIIYKLPIERLQQLAVEPAYGSEIATLIDAWVSGLSWGVTKDITPRPQADVQLQAGEEFVVLKKDKRAHAKKGIVWLELHEGASLFIGMEELVFGGAEYLFPLSGETWLEAYDATRLRALESVDCVGSPAFWLGLAVFHNALCQCEFINKKLVAVDEFNRLRTKADYRRAAKEAAYQEIASVLQHRPAGATAAAEVGATDPLLAACILVGNSLGITVRPHPDAHKAGNKVDPLAAIAKASRFRMRQVALRDDWWKRDQDAILAYLEASKSPVALLPTGPSSYEMVEPMSGKRTPITRSMSGILSPFAYTFYRPFPDGALKAWDLVKFGARKLQADLRSILLMGALVGVLGTLTPLFTGQIFDSVIPGAERDQLLQYTLALVASALAVAGFTLTRNIAVLRVEGRMDYSIQSALWDRLLDLPSTFFRQYSSGDLADRAGGIDAIRQTLSGVGVSAILGTMTSIFYLGMLFVYNMQLAFVALGLVLAAVGFTMAMNLLQLRHQRKQFSLRGHITGIVLQLLTGISKLRVAGAEDHAFKVWAKAFSELKRNAFTIGRIGNFLAVFNAAFPVLASLAIFSALVSIQSSAKEATTGMSTGQFIAFNSAFGLFLAAMLELSKASLNILGIVPVFERLKPIITTPAEISEDRSYPGELMGEIELFHVNFRYDPDGPIILKNVSIHIKPGEFVAFVGPSGSGKSTVLRLLLGFETPESGNVYYDGQDLATLDLREVRQQIGVVLQTSKLMPTDIFRNILGAHPLTLDDAWEAARMAGMEEDIQQMPMGMHTVISEGGGAFSGGQKQRLMIARAIVNRPRILFFDEATSALDNRTQKIVTDSLDAMHATRIVIAHRLSTILHADRIIVLEAGRVVQEGTYDQLMAQEGPFAELAKRQIA